MVIHPHLDYLAALRLQRDVEHLCALGPRTVAEFLAEAGYRIGGLPCIFELLVEYRRRCDRDVLRAPGGL
jgi:hypothetical protein